MPQLPDPTPGVGETPSGRAELGPAASGGRVHLACFSARGKWGDEIARAIATGEVLGFTEDVLIL